MIDTKGIRNWRTWPEKMQSGVNRGYGQAYYNENRRDHYLTISVTEYENLDKARASVTLHKSGEKEGDTFEGTYAERGELKAQAEAYGRDLMERHPCSRDGDRDAVELLTDLHDALRENGCPPQHDADMCGWGKVGGNPGFQLTPIVEVDDGYEGTDSPAEADLLIVRFNVDGKESGLSYEEWKDMDSDGEVRRKHKPRHPESITSLLRTALEDAKLPPVGPGEIEHTGHQTHWDYDVHYRAAVEVPDDLALPDSVGRRRRGLFA